MLRVLHVSEVSIGGIFSLLNAFTHEQSARGHEVHILASPRMLGLEGVQRHHWSIRRRRPTTYPRAIRELRQTIRTVQPDVIHLHSFFGGFFGRLPLVSGLGDVPVVYQPHAWAFNVVWLSKVRILIQGWERFAGRRTDVIVANCTEEVEEGRIAGVAREGTPLGVAVDTHHFSPVDEATRSHWRATLGVTKPGLLLCLGRLASQKGQDQLVKAWEADPLPDAELVFVGIDKPGPLAALAPTQWGNTVRAVPNVRDVRPWMWACDVLVLPSRYEGAAVTVPEAMACGRPIVTTKVNGVREQVVEGPEPRAGSVVELGAMEDLLREAGRRLTDPELAKAEGLAARERAVEKFETKGVVDRLDAAYDKARARRPGPRR